MTDKTRPRLLTLVIVISLAVLLVFGFLLIRRFSNNHHEQDVEEVQEIVLDDFGFPEGGFLIESEVVRSNQTLSHILSSFSLSPDVIHLIAERMQ